MHTRCMQLGYMPGFDLAMVKYSFVIGVND
jgi:hypothetical protein